MKPVRDVRFSTISVTGITKDINVGDRFTIDGLNNEYPSKTKLTLVIIRIGDDEIDVYPSLINSGPYKNINYLPGIGSNISIIGKVSKYLIYNGLKDIDTHHISSKECLERLREMQGMGFEKRYSLNFGSGSNITQDLINHQNEIRNIRENYNLRKIQGMANIHPRKEEASKTKKKFDSGKHNFLSRQYERI